MPGLLRAYAELAARRPDAPELVLAGRLPPEGIDGLIRQEPSIAGRVRATGYVSDAERQRLYREASMLVVPSFDEGFGITALEAMTIGVPVVASRRGALPEVVGDAGVLVDIDEPGALSAAMEHVLAGADTRRRAGRRRGARARHGSRGRRAPPGSTTPTAQRSPGEAPAGERT